MNNNSTTPENSQLNPSIENAQYSAQTLQYADTIAQKYNELNNRFYEPEVQQKWSETQNILIQRTKEFGFLTFDFIVKSYQITKTMTLDLYNVYKK